MSERVFKTDLRRTSLHSTLALLAFGVGFYALGWDVGRYATSSAFVLLFAGLMMASQAIRVRDGEIEGRGMWHGRVHFPVSEVDVGRSLARNRLWPMPSSRSIWSRRGERIVVPALAPEVERELFELLRAGAPADPFGTRPSGPPMPWSTP